MLVLWIFVILFIVLWRRMIYEEKSVCRKPVSLDIKEEQGETEKEAEDDGTIGPPQQRHRGRGAVIVLTEPPIDDVKTMIGDDMNGSTIIMRIGEKRTLSLRGNATTGYAWRIVKMNGTSVKPDDKWHYRPERFFLIGGGGYFQCQFEAVQAGLTEVFFIYEPVADPMNMTYSYYLQFDVRY